MHVAYEQLKTLDDDSLREWIERHLNSISSRNGRSPEPYEKVLNAYWEVSNCEFRERFFRVLRALTFELLVLDIASLGDKLKEEYRTGKRFTNNLAVVLSQDFPKPHSKIAYSNITTIAGSVVEWMEQRHDLLVSKAQSFKEWKWFVGDLMIVVLRRVEMTSAQFWLNYLMIEPHLATDGIFQLSVEEGLRSLEMLVDARVDGLDLQELCRDRATYPVEDLDRLRSEVDRLRGSIRPEIMEIFEDALAWAEE